MRLKCDDCGYEESHEDSQFLEVVPPLHCMSKSQWWHRPCADEGEGGGNCELTAEEFTERRSPDDTHIMINTLRWVLTRCIESVQIQDKATGAWEHKNYINMSLVEARKAQLETALMDYQTDQEKRLNRYSRHDPGDGPSGRSRHD